jgi:hypothetical protein
LLYRVSRRVTSDASLAAVRCDRSSFFAARYFAIREVALLSIASVGTDRHTDDHTADVVVDEPDQPRVERALAQAALDAFAGGLWARVGGHGGMVTRAEQWLDGHGQTDMQTRNVGCLEIRAAGRFADPSLSAKTLFSAILHGPANTPKTRLSPRSSGD